MYSHVLIPTDGSAQSKSAAAHGVALAAAVGARVSALFVMPAVTPLVFEGLMPVAHVQLDEHAARSAAAADKYLGQIERVARKAGVPFQGLTATDDFPAEAILRIARQQHCDLIVMASHGRRGLASVLLGSETQKVLTHARTPVLVCR